MRVSLLLVPLAAALLLAEPGRVQRDVRTERFATAIVCVCGGFDATGKLVDRAETHRGEAAAGGGDDADFVPGSDETVHDVPFPEIARFRRFYEAAGNPPELIAKDRLVVTE